MHSRLALLLGAMTYALYGILDHMMLSADIVAEVMKIRLFTTLAILSVFAMTFLRLYRKYYEKLLSFITLVASFNLFWVMLLIDKVSYPYYFAGLLLIFFWIHAFQIITFPYVVFTALAVILAFIFSCILSHMPLDQLFSYSFIVNTAAGISIFSAYLTEKHNRFLFLREKELDLERHIQSNRALHDTLTGLPNRTLLFDRMAKSIQDASRNAQLNAGFFLDLDNFKIVNDTYGHAAGDAVLKEVSTRLKASVRGVDTVARLSGDEFFVLAHDVKSEANAMDLGFKLLNAIREPFRLNGKMQDSLVSASIGVCLFPYEGVVPSGVISRADHAMYQAKLSGKNNIVIAQG